MASSPVSLSLKSAVKLSSGFMLPMLGFGVYQNTGPTCLESCLEALKAGYRHIDSAVVYRNEREVGQAVRQSGVNRDDISITTKITTRYAGYESTAKMVDESLKKFGFEYIDLYLIHDPYSGKTKRLETYRALLAAQKAGKIRSVGVSNYGVHHLEEIRNEGLPAPSVNQIELHPFCQQKPIAEYCAVNGIAIEAYSPLVRGVAKDQTVLQVGKSPFLVYIRWSLQRGFIPLPKTATPSRIVENASVFNFELSEEQMAALNALDKGREGAVTWNPVDAP
ncbi:NADP-dependent oxidoreductase domain-containing protein [Cantharellus anzutake]|uniref:NADP-dependent oxidoreductase domain-containing protein n=1 Tax=Cantharellus anzutake TaxID=1750568 RepID=UPI0019054A49|nr:NADP-dependent oxidoreductase domain-containing protein [Cantharellus anzutake]KAF8325463.1 NADP-dependent oxidoreductase domain-containing protein [Cantharellus anzutake]